MLFELFDYLFTPATRQARAMGYLGQSISLKYRFKRCRRFWKPHFAQCEKVIIEAVEKTKRKQTVMILGSGDLQEIPIEYLVAHFQKIFLVDIVHSRQIKRLVKNHPKFEAIQVDLNGFLYQKLNKENPMMMIQGPPSLPPADLIISANLLSQLPLKPAEYLRKHKVADEKIDQVSFELQKNHLSWLSQTPSNILLYSDYELQFLDQNGILIESKATIPENLLPFNQCRQWEWDLAPIPEFDKKIGLKMKVSSCLLKIN